MKGKMLAAREENPTCRTSRQRFPTFSVRTRTRAPASIVCGAESLSFAAVPGRERCEAPARPCHVLAIRAEYSASPAPAGNSPPPPTSPTVPAPAVQLLIEKRQPSLLSLLRHSGAQEASDGRSRPRGTDSPPSWRRERGSACAGCAVTYCRRHPAPRRA